MLSPQQIQYNITRARPILSLADIKLPMISADIFGKESDSNTFFCFAKRVELSNEPSLSALGRARTRIHVVLSRILFGGLHDIFATCIKLFVGISTYR